VGGWVIPEIGQTVKSRKTLHMLTHRIHMTNTLNPFTGTGQYLKSSANLRRPRPLLVVHSGKTTTGRFAELRISSRLKYLPLDASRAVPPVYMIICRRDTLRKPAIFTRRARGLVGCEIAAEPVPVLRPVARVSRCVSCCCTGSLLTGRTNMGSKLGSNPINVS
jgi:hypothetical protein